MGLYRQLPNRIIEIRSSIILTPTLCVSLVRAFFVRVLRYR